MCILLGFFLNFQLIPTMNHYMVHDILIVVIAIVCLPNIVLVLVRANLSEQACEPHTSW